MDRVTQSDELVVPVGLFKKFKERREMLLNNGPIEVRSLTNNDRYDVSPIVPAPGKNFLNDQVFGRDEREKQARDGFDQS